MAVKAALILLATSLGIGMVAVHWIVLNEARGVYHLDKALRWYLT